MNAVLEAALEYARQGWPVVPLHTPHDGICDCPDTPKRPGGARCPKPGKHPRVMHGIDDASLDEQAIRRWWGMWPQANVGISLKAAGLLDVAPDSLQWHAEFVARGLPDTPRFQSGGGEGHEHYLYRLPAGAPHHRICREDEFDLMSNGLAVMPPSLHQSGQRYRWLEQPALAEAPRWCVRMLHESVQRRQSERTVGQAGSDEPPVRLTGDALERWHGRVFVAKSDGTVDRSLSLWELACALADAGGTRQTVLQAIQERDEALGWTKYRGRGDEQERYEVLVDRVLSSKAPVQPQARDSPHVATPGVYIGDMATLQRKVLPEPRWAVPGIFPEGVVLLAGKSKLGKSWFALDVALAVATGAKAWGEIQVEPGEVLYLALEDSERRLSDRMAQVYGDRVWPGSFLYAVKFPRANEGGLELVLKWLNEHPAARLVIIDVLGKFRPREADARRLYDQDYDAIAPIAELARQRGVCVLILHHANKLKPEDPIDSVSGTTGLVGAADAICIFRRERGKVDAALLITGRDVEEQELAFKFVLNEQRGHAWGLMGDAAALRISAERQEILDVVTAQPGVTAMEISAAVGRSSTNVRHMLFKMVRDGQVRNHENRYFPPLFFTRGNTGNGVTNGQFQSQNQPITRYPPGVTGGNTQPVTGPTPPTSVTHATGVTSPGQVADKGVTPEQETICRACRRTLSPDERHWPWLHNGCRLEPAVQGASP